MVVGGDSDRPAGVARISDHGIGIRAEEIGPFGNKFPDRQPDMETAPKTQGSGNGDPPDPGSRILHPDQDQLASGGKIRQLIVNADFCLFQQKGDGVFVGGGGGKRVYRFAGGGDKADGVKLNFLGPEFHGETLFVFGYRQLYGMGQGGGGHRAAVVVAQAGFVSGGGDNGGTGVGAERVQILAQRGSPLMAALAGSQADAADDGEGVPARQGIKIGNSHHDIVFLVGGGALWDQVKVPQILLRGL